MNWLKSIALRGLRYPSVVRATGSALPGRCVVLLLHRFAGPDGNPHGSQDVQGLRTVLEELRKCDIELIDLEDALKIHVDGSQVSMRPSKMSVAFTVDDGYADLVERAGSTFADFDCPVSGFVVPGAVDGADWYWWDKVDYILRHSPRRAWSVDLRDECLQISTSAEPSIIRSRNMLEKEIKSLAQASVSDFISDLALAAEVDLPSAAPREYRVLGWSELRAAEASGFRFGSHSMTHPILSKCSNEQAAYEIEESVVRVRRELSNPLPVFCYPNGAVGDYGEREVEILKRCSVPFALSTQEGLLEGSNHRGNTANVRYNVPRLVFDANFGRIVRYFFRI